MWYYLLLATALMLSNLLWTRALAKNPLQIFCRLKSEMICLPHETRLKLFCLEILRFRYAFPLSLLILLLFVFLLCIFFKKLFYAFILFYFIYFQRATAGRELFCSNQLLGLFGCSKLF